MLRRDFAIAILAAVLAAATPTADNIPPLLCNSGDLFCCNGVVDPANFNPAINALLELLDIDLDDIVSPIGLICSTENVVQGVGCQGTNACCSGTNLLFGTAVLDCSQGVL
ncbi:hypothetical protein PENSPDRAFT_692164 [Peniophora sp. CONT]|nr:hypothetical protein PENSPDRAFT_692164 [Peniophora sp. CONT]